MTQDSKKEAPFVINAGGVLTEKQLIEFAYKCFHDEDEEQTLFVSPLMLKALVAYNSERFRLRPSGGLPHPWTLVTGIGYWKVLLDDSDHSDEPGWAASSFPLEGGAAIARLDNVHDYAF